MIVCSPNYPGESFHLGFNEVKGFVYVKGHEYKLLVKETILANPPADTSDRTYELIRILEDRLVEKTTSTSTNQE